MQNEEIVKYFSFIKLASFLKLEYKMLILMGGQRNQKFLKGNLKRRLRHPKTIYSFDPAILCVENFSTEII